MKRVLPGRGWKLDQCRHMICRQQVSVSENSFLNYWTHPNGLSSQSTGHGELDIPSNEPLLGFYSLTEAFVCWCAGCVSPVPDDSVGSALHMMNTQDKPNEIALHCSLSKLLSFS